MQRVQDRRHLDLLRDRLLGRLPCFQVDLFPPALPLCLDRGHHTLLSGLVVESRHHNPGNNSRPIPLPLTAMQVLLAE